MTALKPTLRMKRLYHHLVEHRWGEPADLVVYDRSRAAVPGALEQLHVASGTPTRAATSPPS